MAKTTLRASLAELKQAIKDARASAPLHPNAAQSLDSALRQVLLLENSLLPQDIPQIPITSAMVTSLRDRTDMPLMECKKALMLAGGNEDQAAELLRTRKNLASNSDSALQLLAPLYRWLSRAKFESVGDEVKAAEFGQLIHQQLGHKENAAEVYRERQSQ